MAEKLMYIPNANTQNCLFYKLQLVIETFGHSTNKLTIKNSIKVQQIVMPTNKKTLFGEFGDYYNKQPIVPSLPTYTHRK